MYQVRKVFTNIASKNLRKPRQPFENRIQCVGTVEIPPQQKTVSVIPKGVMGQPTCHTHPHLIPPGQLTCGTMQAEYLERRTTLVNKLVGGTPESMHKNHVIVIPAACKQYMSDKIPYVFRQNSDFFYLTGCLEPSAILVIVKSAAENHFRSILFVQEKDSHQELWEGPQTGCSNSAKLFQVDEARPVHFFNNFISQISVPTQHTMVWYHSETPANPEIHNAICSTVKTDNNMSMNDPKLALHQMRVIKSPSEIELMRESCFVGCQAMNMAMACTRPGVSEHMVNAVLEYSSKQGGAEHLAFPPVVAGGPRATHIHYVNNNQLLQANEMILVDSGCQRWLYNSDISRTWPVSGKFSRHHRILYELVLAVQKRLIEILGEHRPPLDHLFDSMCRLLGTHLQQEGVLPKTLEGHTLFEKAYRLCPHHVSHYLGLDVHDAPLVKRNIPVKTSMIVTVEPGIYIRQDDTSVPPEFRGIGIRIEDDVLITDKGVEVLTRSCVKDVRDIEAMVGKHSM